MCAYESLDPSLATYGTDLFLNHEQWPVPDSPCFVGARVHQYNYAISLWKIICNMSCAFTCIYKGNLSVMNVDKITCMNEYCKLKESREFFNAVYHFQRDAVLDWNPGTNSVTMSFNIGFIGICKDSSAGAGSVMLDMLLKFGVLKYNECEIWELGPNARMHCLYSFGDRKSN
jgi:hypothetical protein